MEPNTVMLFVWIGLMVAFTVIEAVTVQLVTIWFAVGSLVALIANIAGANIVVQWIVFVAVSAVCLLATRPLVKKVVNAKAQPTNADRCIGATALVTEAINNEIGTGQVNVKGIIWTARSLGGEQIEKGEPHIVEHQPVQKQQDPAPCIEIPGKDQLEQHGQKSHEQVAARSGKGHLQHPFPHIGIIPGIHPDRPSRSPPKAASGTRSDPDGPEGS